MKNERYTREEDLKWILAKCGIAAFDLDVAACEAAHCAPRWYSKELDGLTHPWFPFSVRNVFCNPPWDHLEPWVARCWSEMDTAPNNSTIALLIPGNRTEQPFWQALLETRRDRENSGLRTHFLPKRTRFGTPDDPKGLRMDSPPFTSVLCVFTNH